MPRPIESGDIVGKRFGKLTVRAYDGFEHHGRNKVHWYVCDCDCGTKGFRTTRSCLLKGDTKSCGCAHKDAGNAVLEDLTGQRFGRLTVVERAPNRVSKSGKTRSIMWLCRCDCGVEKAFAARALKTGMTRSCGCLQKERVSDALTLDLVGQRFAHVTVLNRNGSWRPKCYGEDKRRGGVRAVWHCRCDCGTEFDAVGESLRNGDVTSCGCSHTSKYESCVAQYFDENGLQYEREKTFQDLSGCGGGFLRFDFYVTLGSGENVLIECQGEQHYRSTKWFGGDEYLRRLRVHDKMKRTFAEKNGIRLIEVPFKLVTYDKICQFLNEQLS